MFSGASAINLDAKGRIAIPKRYRETLHARHNNQLVITVDIQSSCLLLYPIHEWEQVAAKLASLSDTQPTERAMKRLLLGYAHECELDGNGRMLLPTPLRQYANLDKRAMLVGQLNKFELWDEAAWQQQIEQSREAILNEDLAANERLADFSL
ncbi:MULTISPECIES: division/cell wall cluster transcriptional repressor MraZ [unclassified Shewanella]|uniref:division/cell wall cluster transcriptional repressor MraZ n=1 Tax=unclassified Shewanella TaxID=196818 RepID=UPI001BBA4789|nr:division/cell wall cluster transcriptional repressor MraZ [Shewanella sp. MBTL60-007]MCG9730726.1 division/cell wall cluster transcriptional repressor MraZ [Shewanella sp. Isolate13]GIU23271.1 transcriptional regulator MraZ [Shewanella sp. MBTL60-007]